MKSSVCMCFWFHQKPKAVQTVKLTLDHRTKALLARYTDIQSVETNQTAHISLQLSINVKEQTPRAKNQTVAPITSARPPKSFPKMPTVSPMRPAVSPTRPTVSPVCPKRLSSAGEGGSKYNRISPQAENWTNLRKTEFS
ncbi:hypothetical protein RUM4293_00070 [Ruegeria atlantica]|uniref:Uncharacterized protein n=1 Tax=Ruegeria atlantica TaxID=81569 RepID=A0A0P1E0M2_9RHOB|nr:hypothetical protein RUM4293_00070 [Ruegeria atlantica]